MDFRMLQQYHFSRKKRKKTETWRDPQISINHSLDNIVIRPYSGIPHKSAWTAATGVDTDDSGQKSTLQENTSTRFSFCEGQNQAVKYMELSAWFL